MEGQIPECIQIHTEEGSKEVHLVDVQALLSQHEETYPLELPSGAGALVFKRLPYTMYKELNYQHRDLLTPEYYETLSKLQAMKNSQKPLTAEEMKLNAEFEATTWPYTLDLLWHMLEKPAMSKAQFAEFLNRITEEDRTAIFQHCMPLIYKTVGIDPKNL